MHDLQYFNTTELSVDEQNEINGGFLFLILAAPALAASVTNALILASPVIASFQEGWDS